MRAHGVQAAASSPAQHAPHGPACFRVKLIYAFFSISENLQHRRNFTHEWHAAEVTQNKQRDTFFLPGASRKMDPNTDLAHLPCPRYLELHECPPAIIDASRAGRKQRAVQHLQVMKVGSTRDSQQRVGETVKQLSISI